jgi:hypothetical protein
LQGRIKPGDMKIGAIVVPLVGNVNAGQPKTFCNRFGAIYRWRPYSPYGTQIFFI